jgi:hypothetical protein
LKITKRCCRGMLHWGRLNLLRLAGCTLHGAYQDFLSEGTVFLSQLWFR